MSEIFSDSARGNPPKNQDELKARLKSIEICINNDEKLREVSIEFCKQANVRALRRSKLKKFHSKISSHANKIAKT